MKRDLVLASSVVTTEDRVDALPSDIEETGIGTIARRQPVAVDVREIVGVLRIANDLERISDLAANISKRVTLLPKIFRIKGLMLQIQRMTQIVPDQLMVVL